MIDQVLKTHGQDYLVGNQLSKADVHLVELLYHVEEVDPTIITSFPLLQVTCLTGLGGQGPCFSYNI